MLRTYGKVAHVPEQNCWVIRAEPHVSLRLKRVFSKIERNALGVLRLEDTIDNARDLQWFMQRYPLECSQPETLAARAEQHRERESLVNTLLNSLPTGLDFPMALPPRDYQQTAAALTRTNHGLLLADDVGLGKSIAAIAAFIAPEMQPVLIATLAHLPGQWRAFLLKFAPHLRVHVLKKGTPYDLRDKAGDMPHVVISSYHKLHGWTETLAPIIKTVIWDEVQELRHTGTAKASAAAYFAQHAAWRMGLSATPIYNYGNEMFNVMESIAPGALGSRAEFLTEWCHDGQSIHDPQAFGSYMRESGLMLRRTRKDVGRELPACSNITVPIEANTDALDKLGAGCDELAHIILGGAEQYRGQKMHAAAEFDMRMRQATGIAKAPFVAEFVRMLHMESGEPIVLYGWHREVYSIWEDRLSFLNPVLYTGTESVSQKEKSKQAFMSGESKLLLISLRSGAGLDGLQDVCSTVVFGELDWSPGVHEQCTGRVNRDGQQHPVFAYYPLADSGSDPIIADVLGLKAAQIDGINNPHADIVEQLQVDPDHVKKLALAYLKHKGKR